MQFHNLIVVHGILIRKRLLTRMYANHSFIYMNNIFTKGVCLKLEIITSGKKIQLHKTIWHSSASKCTVYLKIMSYILGAKTQKFPQHVISRIVTMSRIE